MPNNTPLVSLQGKIQARILSEQCKKLVGLKSDFERIWLHFHIPHQRIIIEHYMQIYNTHPYTKPPVAAAIEFLHGVIKAELGVGVISKVGDVKILESMQNGKEKVKAAHEWLLKLGENVCLIQWCSAWKNEMSVWTDTHAPLGLMMTVNQAGQLPTYVSHKGLRFKPQSVPELTSMDPQDLIRIIKLLWRKYHVGDITDGISPTGHILYEGEGMSAPDMALHAQRRHSWYSHVRELNKIHQENWEGNHEHETYKRMEEWVHNLGEMKSIERENESKRMPWTGSYQDKHGNTRRRTTKNGDIKKLMVPASIEEDTNYEAQFQLRVCGQKPAKKINCRL